MAITYDKDGAYIEIVENGVIYRRSIKWEDCVVSVPAVGTEKIDMAYINSSDQLVLVLEDESEITVGDVAIADHVAETDPHTGYVLESLFNAHSILISVSDNTPVVLEVPASRLIGRSSTGNITALAKAAALAILNVEDGATADLTGAEIVALLEALSASSRLSHTKLDDVGVSDHHAKYLNSEALAAAVQAGAITDGVTKAPTHDAVFDVKTTADAAQPAATDDADAVAAVEAAGLTLAVAKYIKITTPTGDHTASGWAKTETAGAALVFGQACYVGTDGKMEKALADDAAITIPATHLCISETIAEDATGLFLLYGEAYDASWSFDIGKSVYLSKDTAGTITKTMPTKVTGNQVQVLGQCVMTIAKILWNPNSVVVEYA